MPRWLKGTFDHDSDGKPGGSLPGDRTMAKPTKKSSAKAAEDALAGNPVRTTSIGRAPKKREKVANEVAETATDPVIKKTALEEQFDAANEAGAPARHPDEIAAEELRVQRAATGF